MAKRRKWLVVEAWTGRFARTVPGKTGDAWITTPYRANADRFCTEADAVERAMDMSDTPGEFVAVKDYPTSASQ